MYYDISYPFSSDMAIYPGNPPFSVNRQLSINHGDSANVSIISMGSHSGTHIDAPSHILNNSCTIDSISLEQMNGKAKVLSFYHQKEIGYEDLTDKGIAKDDIILLQTDNSIKYGGIHILDSYVTLDYKGADYLVECGVKMVCIDYLTIERPRSQRESGKSIHKILMEGNIVIGEAVSLTGITPGAYRLHCYPINIVGCDGAPVRMVLEA